MRWWMNHRRIIVAINQVKANGVLNQNCNSGDERKWTNSQYILEKPTWWLCMYNELLKEKGAIIVMMVTNFLKVKRIMWKQDNSHHTPDIFIYPYSQPQIECTNYIKICINIRIYHKFLNNMFHICEEIFSVHFALLPGVHDYFKKILD